MIANATSLTDLEIGGCVLLNDRLETLLKSPQLRSLKNLSLSALHVNDDLVSDIPTYLPNIQRLDMSLTQITGVGVKALVVGLKGTLQWLCLDECRYVSVDAVEYARREGVAVKFGFPDNLRNGKRVRLSH